MIREQNRNGSDIIVTNATVTVAGSHIGHGQRMVYHGNMALLLFWFWHGVWHWHIRFWDGGGHRTAGLL